jgi:hypothetical protein
MTKWQKITQSGHPVTGHRYLGIHTRVENNRHLGDNVYSVTINTIKNNPKCCRKTEGLLLLAAEMICPQISKVSKVDRLRFVSCPLLVPVFQGLFFCFAAAINSTNEANKAGSLCHLALYII